MRPEANISHREDEHLRVHLADILPHALLIRMHSVPPTQLTGVVAEAVADIHHTVRMHSVPPTQLTGVVPEAVADIHHTVRASVKPCTLLYDTDNC